MRNARHFLPFLLLLILLSLLWGCAARPPAAPAKIRVLLVTGGHEFEHDQFFQLFADNPDITFRAVEHPNALALLRPEAARQFDVLVLYDLNQEITEENKADFLAWLEAGKGLVVLHHAIADYQQWPEYARIIGARYYLQKTMVDGVEKPRSIFKHGMHFRVHVADPDHPVTRGLQDYDFHDETYRLFDLADDCHPLLTTDKGESNKVIAWSKTYAAARVIYIQSGHDHFAYEDPNYQRFVRQAILWVDHKQ